MPNYIVLVRCADEMGLIHRISGALLRRELNIEELGEHIDEHSKQFFLRAKVCGEVSSGELESEISSLLPRGASVEVNDCSPKDLVLLAGSENHCLGDLLIRDLDSELNCRILAVVSNHEKVGELVTKFGHPFHFVPHQDKSQAQHEAELLEIVSGYDPALIVLAKYMRILSPGFVERYPRRIVNIHHSFLPAFIGAKPYHQAFERGVKIIGATAHFVTDELDQGPIIAQDVIRVDHRKSAKAMIQAGRNVEKIVLAEALKMVLEDRVFVHGNRTVIFE